MDALAAEPVPVRPGRSPSGKGMAETGDCFLLNFIVKSHWIFDTCMDYQEQPQCISKPIQRL